MSQECPYWRASDWIVDWRLPSSCAKLILLLVAISLFMFALQILIHLAGESVAAIFTTFQASQRLEFWVTALFTVDLARLIAAVVFVATLYWLRRVAESKGLLSGPRSSFFHFGDLESDEEAEDDIDEERGAFGAWTVIHFFIVMAFLHVTWNGVLATHFSVGFIVMDRSIASLIDHKFGTVLLTYLSTFALFPFWFGALLLGLARRRSGLAAGSAPSRVVQAVPYVLCYATLMLVAVWWWRNYFA